MTELHNYLIAFTDDGYRHGHRIIRAYTADDAIRQLMPNADRKLFVRAMMAMDPDDACVTCSKPLGPGKLVSISKNGEVVVRHQDCPDRAE